MLTFILHLSLCLLQQSVITLQPGQSVSVSCQAVTPPPNNPFAPAPTGLPALASDVVVPVLPQAWPNLTYPTVTGKSWPLHAGGDLQAAMNGANCGDEIVLDAGVTWSSNYTAPLKSCAAKPILVRSSAIASLPAGVQVKQAQAGLMPTIVTPNTGSVLNFSASTAGWYFAGIQFTIANNVVGMWNLITLSASATTVQQLPQSIVFDRVLVHGNNQQSIRGFLADAAGFGLVNSQVYGFYAVGQDTQAVLAYNSPGPFAILNNYLEAAGENIMFGGGTTTIPGVVPSDATIRLNLLAKQPGWYKQPAPCGGDKQPMCYDIKDNFEVKNGQRILFDSNISTYPFAQGQGECWIINTPAPWGLTALDITITNNECLHAPKMFGVAGITTTASARLLVRNNLATDINPNLYGTNGQLAGTVSGPNLNWTLDHNTIVAVPLSTNLGVAGVFFGDPPPSTETGFTFTNNLLYGAISANSDNPYTTLTAFGPTNNLSYDVFVGDTWPQGCVNCNPAGPAYPASAHFWSATSTATPLGNNAPCNYPAGLSTTCAPWSWALVKFVDYAGGSTGANLAGLALSSASPYHNAGSDGADIGANVAAVLAAVAPIPLTQ